MVVGNDIDDQEMRMDEAGCVFNFRFMPRGKGKSRSIEYS